ncbi:hypothetical protein FOBRF1_006880 [Fusarium oxysporum]
MIIISLNHNLDRPALGIRRRLKGLEGILQLETVSNQLRQGNHTVLNKTNGSRPGIAVSVLQLNIDLAHTRSHEGNVDIILSDTNDEDLDSELERPDSRRNAALDTRTL